MNAGARRFPRPIVAITGGAGFLGRALIRELRKPDGEAVLCPREIRVLDTQSAPAELDGVRYQRGDVRRIADLRELCAGADLVFHLAALVDWGNTSAELLRDVNVGGTRNVVDACRACDVGALVATSSLDVVYGGRSIHDADESTPCPSSFPSAYCATKAEAERVALAAHGTPLAGAAGGNGTHLRTIVIRPCSIWGEDDPYHVEAMLKLARQGPVVRLGREPAPTQFVYVGNVAHAVALAGKALLDGKEDAAGQVYFAADFPARGFFDHLEPIVRAAGGRMLPASLALPRAPIKALSYALVAAARLLRPFVPFQPLFTPWSVDYVCNTFTVKSDKAERLLGYRPIYTEDQAYARTLDAVRRRVGT
jgi:nucleoside-diphosphate-sugar epimerase